MRKCIARTKGMAMRKGTGEFRRAALRKRVILFAVGAAVITTTGAGAWYLLNLGTSVNGYTPHCDLAMEDDPDLKFIIGGLEPHTVFWNTVSWNDLTIRIEATPTDSNPYEYAYWQWYPTAENLTGQYGQPITYSMTDGVPNYSLMLCNLTDVLGDGHVGNGDFFTLTPMTDHASLTGIPCWIVLTYKVTDGTICSLEFTPGDSGAEILMLYLTIGVVVVATAVAAVIILMHRKNPRFPQTIPPGSEAPLGPVGPPGTEPPQIPSEKRP
jgi:hypothetical protein